MPSAYQLGRWICLLTLFLLPMIGYGRDLLQEEVAEPEPEASDTRSGQSEAPGAGIPVSDRVQAVHEASSNPFSLASHKTNYVLPASYNDTLGEGKLRTLLPQIGIRSK
ncbi:hypothetical protein [Microbulbifer taiwanensis]|uniref:hypothetical protein n=1 Tax=Microbulbifer taiwanensis TaxID=986746 RepID=UPI0036205985